MISGRTLVCLIAFAWGPQTTWGQVSQIDPADLLTTDVEDFSSVPPDFFNGLLSLPPLTVGEHFQGQTVDTSGSTDVLTGTPTGLLTVVAGPTDQNLYAATDGDYLPGSEEYEFVLGIDRGGSDDGTLAVLFDDDESQVGLFLNSSAAGGSGTIFIDFFDRNGSNLGSFMVNVNDELLAFESNSSNIAGVSLYHTGSGFFGISSVHFSAVPEPSNLSLVFFVCAGLALWRFRQRG